MRKLFPALARALAAGLLTVFDVAPFVLLLPFQHTDLSTSISLIVILALGAGAAWLAVKLARERSRTLLIVLSTGAMLNILTQVVTRVLPSAILDRLAPGVIAPLFGLDGEYAFDAAGYELWWEIWLFLAVVACAIAWAIRHGIQTRTQ
ncbi:hypothetical protein LJR230_000425 [Trinickia sp. LjRoot230]|uniref:hypothetical protein n=1 Tax=Trinickia sp. LjRoot230 TaxID=3342288 RepID=UPI003ECF35D0